VLFCTRIDDDLFSRKRHDLDNLIALLRPRAGNAGAIFVKSTIVLACVLSAAATSGFFAETAFAWPGRELAGQAKVSMAAAIVIAQKARPGTVTDKELERERGGSGLRYSFDIKTDERTYEVGVDAVTGKVLENGPEGRNPD
jgi:hypothetical protein